MARELFGLIPGEGVIMPLLRRHRYALLMYGLGAGPFASHACRLHSNLDLCRKTAASYIWEGRRRRRQWLVLIVYHDGNGWMLVDEHCSQPAEARDAESSQL